MAKTVRVDAEAGGTTIGKAEVFALRRNTTQRVKVQLQGGPTGGAGAGCGPSGPEQPPEERPGRAGERKRTNGGLAREAGQGPHRAGVPKRGHAAAAGAKAAWAGG